MRVCSSCGKENPDEGIYCSFCGKPLTSSYPSAPETANDIAEGAKRDILKAVVSRRATDRRISPAWSAVAVLYVIPIISGYALSILLVIMSIHYWWNDYSWSLIFDYVRSGMTLTFGLLFGLLVFRLMSRMNDHMEREEGLRKAVMNYMMASSRTVSEDQGMLRMLMAASAFDGQSLTYEKKLPARRWAVLIALAFIAGALRSIGQLAPYFNHGNGDNFFILFIVLALVSFILGIGALVLLLMMASSLMRGLYTHGVRWNGFVNATGVTLRKLGRQFPHLQDEAPPKERSLPLYVLLTIITFGAFGIYWLYVLIDDPNKHFESQHYVEDALVKAIR